MSQTPDRVKPLHQHLKRHILVFVGSQTAPPHPSQQLTNTGITGQINPQNQSVNEKPHQLIQRAIRPPGNRKPHRHITASADPRQQHRQSSLHHHETGRIMLTSHPTYLLLQLRRPLHRNPRTTEISNHRIRPIRRKINTLGHPRQRLLPISQLGGDRTITILEIP